MSNRSSRRVVRFYVEGRAVDAEAFWQAIRDAGGEVLVRANDPKPLQGEAGYRLTPEGEAAVREEEQGR